MNKPDFEKMANEFIASQYAHSDIGMNAYPCNLAYKAGMEKIWTDYVEPLQSELNKNNVINNMKKANMKPDIKDYLHLYCGSYAKVINGIWKETIGKLRGVDAETVFLERCDSNFTPQLGFYTHGRAFPIDEIKPILRRLSNMKDDEIKWINRFQPGYTDLRFLDSLKVDARITQYLLSKDFDLFELIDEGLAIDVFEL